MRNGWYYIHGERCYVQEIDGKWFYQTPDANWNEVSEFLYHQLKHREEIE